RALRLPFHGGFSTFRDIVDIPLVARRSERPPDETRRIMKIPGDRPFVLASFGGYGLDVPFDEIARREHLTVVTPDVEAPAPLRLGPINGADVAADTIMNWLNA